MTPRSQYASPRTPDVPVDFFLSPTVFPSLSWPNDIRISGGTFFCYKRENLYMHYCNSAAVWPRFAVMFFSTRKKSHSGKIWVDNWLEVCSKKSVSPITKNYTQVTDSDTYSNRREEYQVRTMFWHNRWSDAVPHVSNRMKRSNLQKRKEKFSVLGCVGGEISFRCRQVTSKVPKTVKNLFVLQFCSWGGSFRHGEMKIWLCLYFQHVTRYFGTDFVEESRRKMQRSEKEHFFAKSAVIGKSIFQIQRVNAVHGRCSSSSVLRDIPSNFTRSVRRRIVLSFWALSGGIDMLPWPNIPSKWADRLGQVHCQYGTFAKLRTSCPREVEFEVVLFFFEEDWYVHRIAVWECFDIGTWTRRISSHVLACPWSMSMERIGHRICLLLSSVLVKKFCKGKRMSVCPARKRKPSILSVSCGLNRFNRCSRWRTPPLQILCQNMVRTR